MQREKEGGGWWLSVLQVLFLRMCVCVCVCEEGRSNCYIFSEMTSAADEGVYDGTERPLHHLVVNSTSAKR